MDGKWEGGYGKGGWWQGGRVAGWQGGRGWWKGDDLEYGGGGNKRGGLWVFVWRLEYGGATEGGVEWRGRAKGVREGMGYSNPKRGRGSPTGVVEEDITRMWGLMRDDVVMRWSDCIVWMICVGADIGMYARARGEESTSRFATSSSRTRTHLPTYGCLLLANQRSTRYLLVSR